MTNRSDVCDPCVKLGTFAGTQVEKRTNSIAWGIVAATGVTMFCAVGLAYLDEWVRCKEPASKTSPDIQLVSGFRKASTYS